MKSRIIKIMISGILVCMMVGCSWFRSAPPEEGLTEKGGSSINDGRKDEIKPSDKKVPDSNSPSDTRLEKIDITEPGNNAPTQVLIDNKALPFEVLYFDYDSPVLRTETRDAIVRNFERMKKVRSGSFVLEGHCDERGSAEYNQALGEKRALAVKQYLTTLNFPVERLRLVSYGKEKAAVTGEGEGIWKMNRRVEIKVDEQ